MLGMAKKKKGEGKGKSGPARSLVEQARYNVSLPPELLERAKRDLKREKYLTPLRLAEKYSVTLSTARKILKALEEEGLIVKFGSSRRAPVYLPADKAKTLPPGI